MRTNLYTRIALSAGLLLPASAFAQKYQLMTDLPFGDANGMAELSTFLPKIYVVAVGIASIMAVVIIILAGFKYMTSEGGKSEAKASIKNALVGLIMLLLSYLLLNTLNPELLKIKMDFNSGPGVSVDFVKIAQRNGSFSGYTEQMIADLRQASKDYSALIAEGKTEEAEELRVEQLAETNYQTAVLLVSDRSTTGQQQAKNAFDRMEKSYDERITSLYEEGMFEEAKVLEAERIERQDTYKQLQGIETLKGSRYNNDFQNKINRIRSSAENSYRQMVERGSPNAEKFKRDSDARITKIVEDTKNDVYLDTSTYGGGFY
jgi:hypothetical protein